MDPFTLIFGGLGAAGTIAGMSKAKKSYQASQAAYYENLLGYQASLESKQRSYEFNIGQIERDIEQVGYITQESIFDLRRSGGTLQRQQRAVMGASGAKIDVGTPLLEMTRTAESIERDITRLRRVEAATIEGMEAEKEFTEEQVEETKDEIERVKETFPGYPSYGEMLESIGSEKMVEHIYKGQRKKNPWMPKWEDFKAAG